MTNQEIKNNLRCCADRYAEVVHWMESLFATKHYRLQHGI